MIIVGIDIGTSSAKICGRNVENEKIVFDVQQNYGESCSSTQDPLKILEIVVRLLERNTRGLEISEIWTCGQMHGIVCWQSSTIFEASQIADLKCSLLYNWMFECPQHFLDSLPNWKNAKLFAGFGLVTLSYLHHSEKPDFFQNFDKCGTIMELFLSFLTKSKHVKISHHNAYSWGYCSLEAPVEWQRNELIGRIPDTIDLPRIVTRFDEVYGSWNGAKCYVASGDLQASVASLKNVADGMAYLIIGTSAQLCLLHPIQTALPISLPSTVVKLPFSSTHHLLATCSMNGGNAVQKIFDDHIFDDNRTSLRDHLTMLNDTPRLHSTSKLRIDPIFIAERASEISILHIPENIGDFDKFEILDAAHFGVIRNIFSMFLPMRYVQKLGLVGAAKEPRFRRHIELMARDTDVISIGESEVSTQLGATKFG